MMTMSIGGFGMPSWVPGLDLQLLWVCEPPSFAKAVIRWLWFSSVCKCQLQLDTMTPWYYVPRGR